MDKTCATCKNWNPKKSGPMARNHLALCDLRPRWVFLPPHQTCPKHQPAPEPIVAARLKWLG